MWVPIDEDFTRPFEEPKSEEEGIQSLLDDLDKRKRAVSLNMLNTLECERVRWMKEQLAKIDAASSSSESEPASGPPGAPLPYEYESKHRKHHPGTPITPKNIAVSVEQMLCPNSLRSPKSQFAVNEIRIKMSALEPRGVSLAEDSAMLGMNLMQRGVEEVEMYSERVAAVKSELKSQLRNIKQEKYPKGPGKMDTSLDDDGDIEMEIDEHELKSQLRNIGQEKQPKGRGKMDPSLDDDGDVEMEIDEDEDEGNGSRPGPTTQVLGSTVA